MRRPKIPSEVIKLIRRISLENPNWGATHIQGELMMLGHFLTIPTITFKTLYVSIVLSLDRRRVVHFHVTQHPTADWTELQLIQAFPFDTAPKYLIRDRDGIYGEKVLRTIDQIGIEDRPTSPHSPWQNGYCERMVCTLKRECLNHMVIFNERHARRIIREFLEYYHEDRTHQGLDQETPRG